MPFTVFFLVVGGKKYVFCKGFRFIMVESVCFGSTNVSPH